MVAKYSIAFQNIKPDFGKTSGENHENSCKIIAQGNYTNGGGK
jgi:hypothetical protein